MKFEVITSRRAKRDIFRVLDFLAQDSATRGERWLAGIERAIQLLESLPERYSIAVELSDPPRVVREFLHGKRGMQYRIFYEVVGNRVHVKHIRHASREQPTPEELSD